MLEARTRHQDRQQLADRLILEYAGAVAPGKVLAAVARIDRLLQGCHADPHHRMTLCEDLVRHRLLEHTAGQRPHLAAVAS